MVLHEAEARPDGCFVAPSLLASGYERCGSAGNIFVECDL